VTVEKDWAISVGAISLLTGKAQIEGSAVFLPVEFVEELSVGRLVKSTSQRTQDNWKYADFRMLIPWAFI
jgi:hypothetical protein